MSPCNNQVALCSPPYGRDVDVVVGGGCQGSIKSGTDIYRPRPGEVLRGKVTKRDD
jgi:hypothetical protein